MTPFAGWENFYVVVGSSAGALIGLQFVVITLIASRPVAPGQDQAGEAFATPSVCHFGVVLFLSAIANAPWRGLGAATVLLGLFGLWGMAYEIRVARNMREQKVYAPEFEDWWFHLVLPFAAYATLAASAFAAHNHLRPALFSVGAATLLLLFVGIYNAWDNVTYHVFHRAASGSKSGE